MYVKEINGVLVEYTDRQLKADNSNVSFPGVLDDNIRAEFGMHPCAVDEKPAFNPVTEKLEASFSGEPGSFVKSWAVVDLYDNEQDEAAAVAAHRASLAEQKQQEINADFAASCEQIKAGYPADEVLIWDRQIDQARAYLADDQTSVPLLEQMAPLRNETVAVLAQKILDKAALFETAYGQLLGQRQSRSLALDAIDLQAQDAEQQIAAI